jgi:hypothetical protein
MMIPILEPVQYPAILANGLLITVIIGIPTALLSLVIFFLLERVPFRQVRLFLPVAGAVLMLAVKLVYFSEIPQSPEEYQNTWVQSMLTSFLLNALVILAPFPFIRKYTAAYSPYIVIPFTLVVTFFLLIAFGFMGGDAQKPPATEYGMMMITVYLVVAEVVVATIVYGCIAWFGTKISSGTVRQE